jgi:hypothetical protein
MHATKISPVLTKFRKKAIPRAPKSGQQKRHRELVAALIVGLIIAAIVGYLIYWSDARHS